MSMIKKTIEQLKIKIQSNINQKDKQTEVLQEKINTLRKQITKQKDMLQKKIDTLKLQNAEIKNILQEKIDALKVQNVRLQNKIEATENQISELYDHIQKKDEHTEGNRYAYITNHNNNVFVGSSYKYFMCLQQRYGGLIIDGRIGSLAANLKKIKPKIGFTRGDYCTYYKDFLELEIPYILIQNDIASLRSGKAVSHEKEMIENAAAVIFPSEHFKKYCEERYEMPVSCVIHLKPLKNDIGFTPLTKPPGKHLVYVGGIVDSSSKNGLYGYRAYYDIFKAFMEAGWVVHIYPATLNAKYINEYTELGCIVHHLIPYQRLLREISQYTAGLQAYNTDDVPESAIRYIQSCVPNKVYDYLAAGLPTIGYNTGSCRSIYEGKWGIVLDKLDPDELKDLHTKLPEITEQMRFSQVMENDLPVIDKILKKAIDCE